ncbi:MobA/MobL protein [Pseudomonas coronafaciens pv. zizaniae]|nr:MULTISPECIES: MobA/MobL family protein [Pseudomonas syringae group]RMO11368.1 MobA/MobL protein [Pseudomonas coronafaciens pv. zizaniae]
MAIGRLSMKVGKAGKAGPHAAYIAREGKYAARLDQNEKLEATESGNMPVWAQHCPQEFWNAADRNERKNGTTYREMEIALPRELSPQQRANLVRDFVRKEVGDRHAYQWAIHTPKAADGGEQPHVHLMFSERQRDRIERDPEQYFKRYNAKNPAAGGARKGYGPSAGLTLSAAERKAELRQLRDRWEKTCNSHLEQAGAVERIDMRSHAERNTGLVPERKHLPSEWRDPGQRAKVIDFRQARAELSQSREALRREVPSAGAEIISLEAERERRIAERVKTGGSSFDTSIKAVQDRSQNDMVQNSKQGKEKAEQASREEAGRIATALSQQNERRENQISQGKGPEAEKEAQALQDKKERLEQEKAAQVQSRRMEQAKRDESDRLINQLQRQSEQESTKKPSAMEQMKAKAAQQGHVKDQGHARGQNVVSIDQMRARAAEKGHVNDQTQRPDNERANTPLTLEQMQIESESRRVTKEQERDEPGLER